MSNYILMTLYICKLLNGLINEGRIWVSREYLFKECLFSKSLSKSFKISSNNKSRSKVIVLATWLFQSLQFQVKLRFVLGLWRTQVPSLLKWYLHSRSHSSFIQWISNNLCFFLFSRLSWYHVHLVYFLFWCDCNI